MIGNKSKRQGFTLVEMLVVITIMALILGIAIGSFSGMGEATRVNAAYQELTAAVRHARTYATGNGQKVYLVFYADPGSKKTEDVIYSQPRHWYQYYRGYTLFAAAEQKFIMETRLLPPGLIFDDTAPTPSGGITAMSANARQDIIGLDPDAPANAVTLNAVAFLPDGTIETDLKPFWIVFTEGFTNADEKVAALAARRDEKIGKQEQGKRTRYSVRIDPLSGEIQQREKFVP